MLKREKDGPFFTFTEFFSSRVLGQHFGKNCEKLTISDMVTVLKDFFLLLG